VKVGGDVLYSKMMDLKVSFADFLQAQKKPEKVSDGIRKGRSERFIDGNELAIGMRSINGNSKCC
jgi:hypothetical protein